MVDSHLFHSGQLSCSRITRDIDVAYIAAALYCQQKCKNIHVLSIMSTLRIEGICGRQSFISFWCVVAALHTCQLLTFHV